MYFAHRYAFVRILLTFATTYILSSPSIATSSPSGFGFGPHSLSIFDRIPNACHSNLLNYLELKMPLKSQSNQ